MEIGSIQDIESMFCLWGSIGECIMMIDLGGLTRMNLDDTAIGSLVCMNFVVFPKKKVLDPLPKGPAIVLGNGIGKDKNI